MTAIVAEKSMLRIAHVALQLDTGGLERLLIEFARHADRSRFELRFVCLSSRGSVADDIESFGWPVTTLNEPPGIRPGMPFRLSKIFRDWDADVVHTHNTKPLLYAGLAGQIARVPAIVHTSHGSRYGASRADTLVFVNACRMVDRVVCVSRDIEERRRAEGIPAKKVQTIWNGIDVAKFAYHGPNLNGPAVLVARLRPEKDVPTLLRAVSMITAQHPDFRLEIAGDGECAAEWRVQADQMGLSGHVEFLGDVRDVSGLLRRARMLVCSSVIEGLSVSLLEAMATGVPIVATRVGGNVEVVMDGETGLLVPPGDAGQLAAAMMRIWSDPELGRRMGQVGRSRVESNFDVRKMVMSYESIYEQLVTRSDSCRAVPQSS